MNDERQYVWERLARKFVPDSIRQTGGLAQRRAELIVLTIFALLIWGPFFTLLFWLGFGEPFPAVICATVTGVVILKLFVIRWTGHGPLAANLLLGVVYLGILALTSVNGGIRGPSLTWITLLPLLGLVLAGNRSGVVWLVVGLGTYWSYYGLEQTTSPFVQSLSIGQWQLLYTFGLTGLTLIAFLGVWFRGDLQRWLIDELRDARDRALEASEAKSQFLARASHELRTPLTSIIGYSDVLLTHESVEDDEQLRDDLQRIQTAGRHLLTLVDDLLDVSKVQAGKAQLSYRTIEVAPFLEEVAESVAPLADERNNELTVDLDAPGELRTDPGKLRQILSNLADNACKFTDGGTVTLRASRDHQNNQTAVRFVVTDTGIGMTDEEADEVFEAFAQANPTDCAPRGTGLGLTIVDQFTELLGGDLEVESTPGEGTTVRVTIPDRSESGDEDEATEDGG